MNWKTQPIKGVVLLAISFVFSWIYLTGTFFLGVDPFDSGIIWPTTWFFFGFGALSFGGWPFTNKLKQPWAGIIMGTFAWIVGILVWIGLKAWMDPYAGYSVLSYALFFLFIISFFMYNHPLSKLGQPWGTLALYVVSFILGYFLFLILGSRDWEWLYIIPGLLFGFFGEWPVSSQKPYRRGAFWTVVITISTLVLVLILNALGTSAYDPWGGDLLGIIFLAMIPFWAFENWPYADKPQPVNGIISIVGTLAITAVVYLIFSNLLGTYLFSTWSFVLWCFYGTFGLLAAPWPGEWSADGDW